MKNAKYRAHESLGAGNPIIATQWVPSGQIDGAFWKSLINKK